MAVSNGDTTAPRAGEDTPLLRERRRVESDDESSETLTEPRAVEDEERAADDDKANQHVGRLRGLLIILSLWGLIFLQASNMSGITTTQSQIAKDLNAYAYASWFTSTYLIAMSSMSPIAARLAQIFSPRYCIFVASILFSIGGLVTSKAPDLKIFLLGRAISGLGGAGIMTISFILVLELSGKKRRGLYIGLVNTGFTTGVSLGAVIAGVLVPITGWRPLFGAQFPLGLLFGLGIFFSIPESFTSGHRGAGDGSIMSKLARIDYLGAATLTATIISFLYGLSFPKVLWVLIGLSVVLLPIFVIIEIYVSEPIIPVTVLKSRGTLLSCFAQLGIMAARWMVLFYTPVYAIAIRGWNPASAGSILIPTNLGFAIGGVMAGWLHIRRSGSFWLASIISYALFSATFILLSQISNPHTSTPIYLISVFLNGVCTGAALNYTIAHLLHLTPPSTHFISTSLLTTFRGFSGSFGSAIGGGLFIRSLKANLENGGLEDNPDLVRELLGSPASVQHLKGEEQLVAVASYVGALKTLLLAGAGLALCMVFVQAGTGWKIGVVGEESNGLVGNGEEVEGEDWEEGMEQGV